MSEELAAGLLRPGYVIENLIEGVVEALSGTTAVDQSLATILDAVRQLLAVRESYVFVRSGDHLRVLASRGLYESLANGAALGLKEGVEGWVVEHGEPVMLADAASDPRFHDLPGRTSRVGALIALPLKIRGEVIGVLVAARQESGIYSDAQRRWLAILAQMVGVAVENGRLIERERRRSRQAEVLLKLTSLEAKDIDDFLQRLSEAVNEAMAVDKTEVMLAEPGDGPLVARGLAGDAMARRARDLGLDCVALGGDSFIAQVYASRQPMLCNETYDDTRARSELAELQIRSLLAAPIIVDDQVVGVIHLATTRPGSFEQDDLSFLAIIAERVGLQLRKLELAERQSEVDHQQAQQRAREDFTAIVSHELKTPVAVIRAYTEVLLRRAEKEGADGAVVDVLSRIEEQASRMLGMIDQLLDLQRLEGGILPLERSRFDLAELVRRECEEIQVTTNKHRLVVDTPPPIRVFADRRRVEDVLRNLLDNAIKYSPKGGEIRVSLARSDHPQGEGGAGHRAAADAGWAIVSVADRGIGISARERSRIFDRFYQAAGTPYKGRVGLGLGLYISKELIVRHGGQMWVESQVGGGSRFSFSLPLTQEATDAEA